VAAGCERHLQPYPVAAVDPTGAGDAFCAGLAAAVGEGASWPDAVDFACACGSLACRGEGAIPWLPTVALVREHQARRAW
jgi:ribokinase